MILTMKSMVPKLIFIPNFFLYAVSSRVATSQQLLSSYMTYYTQVLQFKLWISN